MFMMASVFRHINTGPLRYEVSQCETVWPNFLYINNFNAYFENVGMVSKIKQDSFLKVLFLSVWTKKKKEYKHAYTF